MTTAYITDSRFAVHTLRGHVENAERLAAIQARLDGSGVTGRMLCLTPEPVSNAQILTVHTEDYLELLIWSESQKGLQFGPDTYVLPQSFQAARLSAGAAIRAVDAVMSGEAENALVCSRPPGHHAIPPMAMGFCLLSNLALAARHAQSQYGLKRILVVDYDVHHGNGTQAVFYSDPGVVFVSTHQYPWYPGTGAVDEIGEDAGVGATVNIPLSAGVGDTGYAQVYKQVIWPVARRFQPELILVSAGFDAHWADPLSGIKLSLKGYDHLSRELIRMAGTFCDGKIVFILEGGYNLESLSHGVLNVANALLGTDGLSDPLGPAGNAEPEITPLIAEIRQLHSL